MVDWPLTFRCNNNCMSCIINTKSMSKKQDPPMEQMRMIVDTLDPENDYLGLSGGEPTLRKELFDILTYARGKHPDLYIFLVSNGRMFSYSNFAKRLADMHLNNFMIGIALYGHNSELHDSITLTKGSFEQTMKGIKNLVDFGVKVEIRVVINKLNYKHLEDIARLVSIKFPTIERLVLLNMKVTGNAYINREDVLVPIKDVVPFAKDAVNLIRKTGIETRLYHFPLCILPENLWVFAEGVTKHDVGELVFADKCKDCVVAKKCPKIWASYLGIKGDDEFHAIKKLNPRTSPRTSRH